MTIEAGSWNTSQVKRAGINSQFVLVLHARARDTKRQTQTAARWNQGKVEMNFYTHFTIVLAMRKAWKITIYFLFIIPNYVL